MRFQPHLLVGALFVVATLTCCGAEPEPEASASEAVSLPQFLQIRKGDLDEIIARGFVRVLVTHNRTNFFVSGGRPRGFEYELLKEYEEALGKKASGRLEMLFLPMPFPDLLPALVEGKGDIVAAGLTVTPERADRVAFTEPYLDNVAEIVVTHRTVPPLASLDDLAGRRVYVRRGSSYARHLEELNDRFRHRGLDGMLVEEAPDYLETEDILELVNAGIIDLTVADDHIAELWASVLQNLVLRRELPIHTGGKVAWAVRKDNPQLLADLNRFVRRHRRGTLLGNVLFRRYFKNTRWIRNPTEEERQRLTELQGLFEKYAERYGFDWLVIAAQAFQESRFDQTVRSRAGAVGLMQILPSTAASPAVGIPQVDELENNVHAGVKYLDWLRDRYFDDLEIRPTAQMNFTLAAYNAGPTRISQLRRKAPELGYDPNLWFWNVERVVLREVGWEPVRYVANINKYYFAFKLSLQALRERQEHVDAIRQKSRK